LDIITLEEHYLDPAVARAGAAETHRLSPDFGASYDPALGLPYSPTADVLTDLGEARLADMDRHGITRQVLSCLSAQTVPADVAVDVVRATNDRAAAAVREHPDRFSAFAALPTAVPAGAADELARAVGELGFVGTMIFGRTGDEFLDAPRFDPILAKAAELRVPIYLHPAAPPLEVTEANYAAGLDPLVTARLQTSAWGWHQETAVHFIHLVLSGVFDRYPDLQVILGHWGEMIPFYLDRITEALPQALTRLERPFSDYVLQNAYVTPSGMFSQAQLQFCVETVGVDRILYSVDYPFVPNDDATSFLEAANLAPADKEKIAHGTTERLLGIDGAAS
jgi:hypothetical protein